MEDKELTSRIERIIDERPRERKQRESRPATQELADYIVSYNQENRRKKLYAANYDSPFDRFRVEDSEAIFRYLSENRGYTGDASKILYFGYRKLDRILEVADISYRTLFEEILGWEIPELADDEKEFLSICGKLSDTAKMEQIVNTMIPLVYQDPELLDKSPSARIKDFAEYRLKKGESKQVIDEYNLYIKNHGLYINKHGENKAGQKEPIFIAAGYSLAHTSIPCRALGFFARRMDISLYWVVGGSHNTLYAETPTLEELLSGYMLLSEFERNIAMVAAKGERVKKYE